MALCMKSKTLFLIQQRSTYSKLKSTLVDSQGNLTAHGKDLEQETVIMKNYCLEFPLLVQKILRINLDATSQLLDDDELSMMYFFPSLAYGLFSYRKRRLEAHCFFVFPLSFLSSFPRSPLFFLPSHLSSLFHAHSL